ncbi:hypothetical protein DPMN_176017 [Dreissena polymorpha]|uniref:Uncharacterized protein n=1 Tax=Dreissena polymorpha TaxID=45954 RepID=A0A9D4IHR5_DREPO|nr:hypothetical protein DPMN_176017 [Dreissena polymorpha]
MNEWTITPIFYNDVRWAWVQSILYEFSLSSPWTTSSGVPSSSSSSSSGGGCGGGGGSSSSSSSRSKISSSSRSCCSCCSIVVVVREVELMQYENRCNAGSGQYFCWKFERAYRH